jgi:surfactin synthase thioesterase subunit
MPSTPSVQLFCLPYAGGSASAYGKWQSHLPSWIEVCPVELPGHGRNIAEPLAWTIPEMVERLTESVQRDVRGPFALFGHSMGAVLAFELACYYENAGRCAPIAAFVSGSDAPSQRDARRYEHLQSDDAILAELQRLAGTPAAVLADAELMELTLPILRADFAACAAYQFDGVRRLRCPIDVFAGTNDTTTPERLAAWRDHAVAECCVHMFPGEHFFIHREAAEVLRCIARRLERLCAQPPTTSRARASIDERRGEGTTYHG